MEGLICHMAKRMAKPMANAYGKTWQTHRLAMMRLTMALPYERTYGRTNGDTNTGKISSSYVRDAHAARNLELASVVIPDA